MPAPEQNDRGEPEEPASQLPGKETLEPAWIARLREERLSHEERVLGVIAEETTAEQKAMTKRSGEESASAEGLRAGRWPVLLAVVYTVASIFLLSSVILKKNRTKFPDLVRKRAARAGIGLQGP